MSKIKKTINECLEAATDLTESSIYDLSKAKHPTKKRLLQNQLDFWSSMKYHLTELQDLKKIAVPQFPKNRSTKNQSQC